MVVTYSKDLAQNISRAIRDVLESPWFKAVFPTRVSKTHRKSNNFSTTAGGEVYATSFDGSLTGFGGDTIIVDDAHNITDVQSPEQLQRTIDLFHSILIQRLNDMKKGRIMVVGHRVHENDLSADLLEEGGWAHLALPIIAPRDQTYKTAYGRWHRRKGELLRPDADDVERIERLRWKLVNPPFELLYQQDVEGQSLPALTAEHFPPFDWDAIRNLPRFISVEPGTDEGDKRSYSVLLLWASNGVTHYLIDEIRERCNFRKLVEITKALARDNIGAPILIEKTASGPALLSALSERQQRRAHAITPRDSKTTRLRRHYDKFLSGRIRLPFEAEFREKYIKEFIEFPHGRHDDQVDATTQFLDFIENHDDLDFSRTTRPGTIAAGYNSQYETGAVLGVGAQGPKAPGLIAGLGNSNYRPVWPQRLDPKAPGVIAVSQPRCFPW
jgi:predicted phage terminase large subunit-like protein